jgi:integrase/recombinase XerD
MVLDPHGQVGPTLVVENRIVKRHSGRRIPLHPELRKALRQLRRKCSGEGPIVLSTRGSAMRPNSIVNWFVSHFRELGFGGCSSHSGRRTFITAAARNVHRVGGSLRDVQLLAGHRSIQTTQGYIDGDTNAQRRLVSIL